MGNVVAGEALRLAAREGNAQIVHTYIATQAALPAHCYNGAGSDNIEFSFNFWTTIGRVFDGSTFPQTANVYPDWLAGNDAAVQRRINLYNAHDYALWHDVWELNQYFKPDNFPHEYAYLDSPSQAPSATGFAWLRTDGSSDPSDCLVQIGDVYLRYAILHLGSTDDVEDRYEIMAYAGEARSKALGATTAIPGFESIDLRGTGADGQPIWPTDDQSVRLHDGLDYSAHKWHSAEFRSNNMRQKGYWKEVVGPDGFNVLSAP